MDALKTGAFISQQRKAKRLTQKQLAKMLNVSDKAVSRWETGKGYPDVETLPRLAECLDVTITEILNGERSTDHNNESTEMALYDVCNTAIEAGERRKRRVNALKLALALVSALLVISVFVSVFTSAMVREYNKIVGSENCIIASDYTELNYFGMVYLPIIVDEASGLVPSHKVLVEEARVEGFGYLAKLPFGETIYAVNGVENNELIYLQTNGLVGYSRFFCRQDKYDEYYKMLDVENYVPNEPFVCIGDLAPSDVKLAKDAVDYLINLKKSDNGITVNEFESEFELYTFEYCPINLGKFKITEDAIYFCPSVVFSNGKEILSYQIDKEYYDYFQNLFSNDNN